MKTLFFIATLALLICWVLQESKTFEPVLYTERIGGVVPVQKTRLGWHPERLVPFVKKYPERIGWFLKRERDRLRQAGTSSQDQSTVAPRKDFVPIRLKNGTEIMGRIMEEKEGIVWIEIEGGRIAFKREEVVSPPP